MFFPEWYSKISNIRSTSSFLIVMLAVFIATIFFAYFRMQFKWEMNEQLYRELKNKETESV
jgi:cbb3-type cytochrome oxidase subunit 3